MTDWASINGERVTQGNLFIPRYGSWVADVALAISTILTDPIVLTVGNLTLKGAIVRAGTYAGSRAYRIVGGAGGWRKALEARAYQRDTGVTSSMVLGDLAIETGETLGAFTSVSLGNSYVRLAGAASRTLAALTRDWWVDKAGVTQIGSRPVTAIASPYSGALTVAGPGGRSSAAIVSRACACVFATARSSGPLGLSRRRYDGIACDMLAGRSVAWPAGRRASDPYSVHTRRARRAACRRARGRCAGARKARRA